MCLLCGSSIYVYKRREHRPLVVVSCEPDLAGANVENRNDIVHKCVPKDVGTRAAVLWSDQAVPSSGVDDFLHQQVGITNVKDRAANLDPEIRHTRVAGREGRAFVLDVDCRRVVKSGDVIVQVYQVAMSASVHLPAWR